MPVPKLAQGTTDLILVMTLIHNIFSKEALYWHVAPWHNYCRPME